MTVTSGHGVVTYIGLTLTGDQGGNSVAIHSEIDGVYSELVNVTILTMMPTERTTLMSSEVTTMMSREKFFKSTCTIEIAISVGVVIATSLCLFMVTVIIACCR